MTRYHGKNNDGAGSSANKLFKIEAERNFQQSFSQKGSMSSTKRDIFNPEKTLSKKIFTSTY